MLKKILSGKACAECRLCCIFDRYDAWETPVFTAEIRDRIKQAKPDAEFVTKDGGYIFRVGELKGDEAARRLSGKAASRRDGDANSVTKQGI